MKKMLMIVSIGILALLFLSAGSAQACHVKIERQSANDEGNPTVGGSDVITVTFTQTHNNCNFPLKDTEFKVKGMKIVGATPWKEVRRGTFVRKFKVEYLKDGDATFNLIRNCYRGGANELLRIQVGP